MMTSGWTWLSRRSTRRMPLAADGRVETLPRGLFGGYVKQPADWGQARLQGSVEREELSCDLLLDLPGAVAGFDLEVALQEVDHRHVGTGPLGHRVRTGESYVKVFAERRARLDHGCCRCWVDLRIAPGQVAVVRANITPPHLRSLAFAAVCDLETPLLFQVLS